MRHIADKLVCPRDKNPLVEETDRLVCPLGHRYPVVEKIPVLLCLDERPTHELHAQLTLEALLGRRKAPSFSPGKGEGVHPFVQEAVPGTCGHLYKPLAGKLPRYPIPDLRLPPGHGQLLLDIGCNWGRWCIAAARKGYTPVGIDLHLDALVAAREVAEELGVDAAFVLADARKLPFRDSSVDVVFSYSVLQHFAKDDVRRTLAEVARVLKPGGLASIQMPNKFGIRSLYHQARRGFRRARNFEVRYWTIPELSRAFAEAIGPAWITVDGYFGLGIQESDLDLLPLRFRSVVLASGFLRRLADRLPWMRYLADSLYVHAVRSCAASRQVSSVRIPSGGNHLPQEFSEARGEDGPVETRER